MSIPTLNNATASTGRATSVGVVSLTLQESRARAALIDDVSYDIDLDLSSPVGFGCVTRIRFAAREPGAATFLELAAADGLRVVVNGVQRRGIYSGGRILLDDLALDNDVVVSARLPYVTDGEGMHTLVDSADAERYVSAYCSMDVAQRVFPCFDQPDLKARIALSVSTPTHWSVLANGRVAEREADEATARWSFTRTPVMPTYLFVVCCGPWASSTWERSVRTVDGHRTATFGWHARASQASQLERDAGELRRITDACFDHYQQVFTEPYPFDDYHQVFAPGLTWGAMETPGAITFRDEFLFRGDPTPEQSLSRAETIAHEMAHMWFGDLATMRWWEDTWLNESFADYMGYAVAADAAGYDATWVDNAATSR